MNRHPTALAALERVPRTVAAEPVADHVRYLHRWPLWTAYPAIVSDVRDLLDRPPLKGAAAALGGRPAPRRDGAVPG